MKYFTIEELTESNTATRRGIDNTPTEEVKKNLTTLVDRVLDPLRAAWGAPVLVNSGYRCPALNEAVGGSKTSDHMTGRAADIEAADRTAASNARLFALVQSLGLSFDQLIDESNMSWVHVSYRSETENRKQILKL
ncbi:MAG: D-Ala-D-Ala carboxypeptidase family metallohydrolase [Phascolarctobacterium sp.]|nr:D-Ala-D-Ala carboxypeptidase family metallohydrolase [Phascolarctobacterium sp.]